MHRPWPGNGEITLTECIWTQGGEEMAKANGEDI